MDAAGFGELVRKLEQRSSRYPRLYRMQVAAVAALGYIYVGTLLLTILGFVVAIVVLATHIAGGGAILAKLLLPALWLAWVLLRALWIRIPDPEGKLLTPAEYPRLAAAVERVRARLDAPRFRRILLDGDFNAAVAQRPRFGLVGPSVNDLMLGLPLMQALSPQEFEAVLAHEMGHVSRRHGRFTHWIYRTRVTWSRLAATAAAEGHSGAAGLLLGRFLDWYAPFFNGYSFVLARQDEYEADASAVEVAGRATMASALVRIEVLGRFHGERHWGQVRREITEGAATPAPYTAFARALTTDFDRTEAEAWLAEALRRPTDYGDTHPGLADRLRAIGAVAAVPAAPTADNAAARFLGPAAATLAEEFDGHWREHVEPQIVQARAEREASRERLEALAGASAGNPAQAWERVRLLHELDREDEARAAAEALLQSHPDHAPALFFVGRACLEAGDSRGIALLERAAILQPPAAPAAQQLVFEYHWRHGRREQAEAARSAMSRAIERLDAAGRERAGLSEKVVLVPHDLPREVVAQLRTALADVVGLRGVYIARRIVVELPETPCYLVGIVPDAPWWRFRKANESAELRDRVMAAADWPESTYFVLSDAGHGRLVRRIRKQPGAGLAGRASTGKVAPLDATQLEGLRLGLMRRRSRRRKVKLTLAAAVAVVVLLVGWVAQLWREDVKQTPLRTFTVAQAAERVRDGQGRVRILVLYHPDEEDAVLVDRLRRWAGRRDKSEVELLAFMTGSRFQAQSFLRFGAVEAGVPRLPPLWIEPWRRGTLDSTMSTLGVRVGKSWSAPLVAVIDGEGRVTAQWQGKTAAEPVIAAAEAAVPDVGAVHATR